MEAGRQGGRKAGDKLARPLHLLFVAPLEICRCLCPNARLPAPRVSAVGVLPWTRFSARQTYLVSRVSSIGAGSKMAQVAARQLDFPADGEEGREARRLGGRKAGVQWRYQPCSQPGGQPTMPARQPQPRQASLPARLPGGLPGLPGLPPLPSLKAAQPAPGRRGQRGTRAKFPARLPHGTGPVWNKRTARNQVFVQMGPIPSGRSHCL